MLPSHGGAGRSHVHPGNVASDAVVFARSYPRGRDRRRHGDMAPKGQRAGANASIPAAASRARRTTAQPVFRAVHIRVARSLSVAKDLPPRSHQAATSATGCLSRGPRRVAHPDSTTFGCASRDAADAIPCSEGWRCWRGGQDAVRFRLALRDVDELDLDPGALRPLPDAPLLDIRPLAAALAGWAPLPLAVAAPNLVAALTRS